MRMFFLLVSTALFNVLSTAAVGGKSAQHARGLRQMGAIPMPAVEGRIDHMASNPDGSELFVAAFDSDVVVKIDIRQRTVVGKLRGIKEPQGLAYISKSRSLAVASRGDSNIRIYDRDLKLIGTVSSLDDADNVRYDSVQDFLYVGYGRGALAIIDPHKSIKIAEIPLDGHPESFQLEQQGKRIFVNVPTAGEIEVLDREKRIVLSKWRLTAATGNFPMALDETNQRLFIGCRNPAKLLALNTVSGQIVANMEACGDTDDLFFDSVDQQVFLSGGEGCISIFDVTDPNRYKTRTVSTPAGSRTSLFVTANRALYVAVPHRGSRRAEILILQALSQPVTVIKPQIRLRASGE